MVLTPRRLFTAILLIALFVMATREIADPDFWWHLRTGQFILETGTIPHGDIFSYTNAGRPWVTHEWLSQVFIYTLYGIGSYPALILTFSAIVALSFALVFFRCKGKPYVAAFAVLLAAFATAPTWGVRPQIISLLLTSVFLFVLERHRDLMATCHAERSEASPLVKKILRSAQNDKGLWVLIPLMILWVNLHSGYALGLALIAIYLFGEIADRIFSPTLPHPHIPPAPLSSRSPAPTLPLSHSPLLSLAIVFVLSLLVVPLNPNGVTMYFYPFETLGSHAMQTYIQEWFSPDFHQIEWQPFAWLIFGTMATVGLSGKRVSLTQILLFIIFGYAGLRSARLVPIFALVAAPIFAEHLWHILETRGWTAALQSAPRISRSMALVNWLLLSVILLAAVMRIGMVIGNQAAVERAKFPAAAVDFVQSQKLAGPLYNAYGWGGYLIWRLYPEQRVFIDGRADVYGDAFMEEFLKAWRGGAGWRAPLERFGVRVVLIEPDAPLATRLTQEPGWKKTYSDLQAVIFQRQ